MEQTRDKSCEACGGFFTQTRSTQKYCPQCRATGHALDIKRRYDYREERNRERAEWEREREERLRARSLERDKRGCEQVPVGDVDNRRPEPEICSPERQEELEWAWARSHGKVIVCKHCGKEFIDTSTRAYVRRLFCSRECANAYREENRKSQAHTLRCAGCGKEFTRVCEHLPKRAFCSRSCYQETLAAEKMERDAVKAAEKAAEEVAAAKKADDSRGSAEVAGAASKAGTKRGTARAKKPKKVREKPRNPEVPLCADCRVPYGDCVRMTSGFRYAPEGAKFDEKGVLTDCPRYVPPKKKR